MKCGVITFHRAINYGGVLQAYALQQALSKLGVENEVIDYRCPSIERQYRPTLKEKLSKPYIKRIVSAILKNGSVRFNLEGFDAFVKQHLRVSAQAYSSANLQDARYDLYIAGSDQIWSYYCAGFDKAYFLDFVTDASKKNAYAASFGVGSIPDTLAETYKSLLADYRYISVREEDGADIVDSLGISRPSVVPDPTLLLTKEEWETLLPSERTVKEKYVLVYLLERNDALIRHATEVARMHGMKVVYINNRLYKTPGVLNMRNVSPAQWVDLVYHAEAVFTNSFHGIAFSINFGKPFYAQGLKSNSKVNSRIENILQKYSLQENMSAFSFERQTDWANVHDLLSQERQKGYDCLKVIIGE